MRPARPEDRGRRAAVRVGEALLRRLRRHRGPRAAHAARASTAAAAHAASWEFCHVAEADGEVVGVLAGFPSRRGEELARRFIALTLPRIPPWRWPGLIATCRPPGRRAPPARRLVVRRRARGPATTGAAAASPARLLDEAEHQAERSGVDRRGARHRPRQRAARALYEACGFQRGTLRRAPDERTRRGDRRPRLRQLLQDGRPRRVAFRASGPLLRGGSSETSPRRGGRGGAGVRRLRRRGHAGQPPGARPPPRRSSRPLAALHRTSSARRATST